MAPARNDPCECGSGKKYKRCCAVEQTPKQRLRLTILGVGLLVVAGVVVAAIVEKVNDYDPAVTEGKVWCETHQQWHDQDQKKTATTSNFGGGFGGTAPAPAPAPGGSTEGQVWCDTHQTWHDKPQQ